MRPVSAPGISRRRRIALGAIAVLLTIAALGGALLVGAIGGRERLDQASAKAIVGGVTSITQGVVSVFGQVGSEPDGLGHGLRQYEPTLDAWVPVADGAGLGTRAVLLIHGLDEPGGIWDQLGPALDADGHTVLRFDYANDQAIAMSADALGLSMGRLESRGVRELDLVCHSMGGLVARDWLTRPGYGAGQLRVETMITLGTPHGGSPWARLRGVAEAREQVQRWAQSDDLDPSRLLGFLRDGTGQAGVDLLPGSAFLRDLDARTMPDDLRVICVVARTDEPSTLAGTIGSASARAALQDLLGADQAGVVLDEIDRLGRELGDGVVPVSSAAMVGADEIIEVHANHRSMVRTIELNEAVRARQGWPDAPQPPAIEIVRDRLQRD
ncbi:MAG: esterase/lipase family protein [Phycisphaerales bacterium JB052]